MPTVVEKTIGNGTRDYTSLQAWEDAAPANLVTSDQVWEGQVYPEGAGTNGEWTISSTFLIGGSTTDATRFKRLRAAPGQSFAENASPVLRYDTAQGVAIRATGSYSNGRTVTVSESFVQLSGLQFKSRGANTTLTLWTSASVDSCVVMCETYTQVTSGVSDQAKSGITITNTIVLHNNAISAAGGTGAITITNCVLRGDGAGTAVGSGYSSTAVLKNTAIFGFSSAGAGVSSSSTYCATDLSSLSGSNHLTNQTQSACFQNSTTGSSLDMRIKSGSPLIDAGTNTGAPAVDVFGVARPQGSTSDIGANEIVTASSPWPLPKAFDFSTQLAM